MRSIITLILITLLFSCSEAPKQEAAAEEEKTEEFVPPPNPFTVKGPDTSAADSSGPLRRAEKPGLKPPKLELEQEEYVLDSLPAEKPLILNIGFKNSGERPLEIHNVRSSSNAGLLWSKLLIAAEEQSSIRYKIKFSEKNKKFSDTVWVESNGGEGMVLVKLKERQAKKLAN